MLQNAASDLGLHGLPPNLQILETSAGSEMDLFKFYDKYEGVLIFRVNMVTAQILLHWNPRLQKCLKPEALFSDDSTTLDFCFKNQFIAPIYHAFIY